jgi:hypothetical protein
VGEDNVEKISAADPDMGELSNRRADNWRPLYAIAEVVAGDWPEKVRRSASSAENNKINDDQSIGVQLLSDLRQMFTEQNRRGSGDCSGDLRAIEFTSQVSSGVAATVAVMSGK